jgi:hypothetical protein
MLSFDVIIFHGQQMLSFLCYFPLNIFCAKINGNYISENGAFTWGETERLLDRAFFGQNFYERYKNSIRGLRLIDCYQNGTFKTQQEFAAMGLPTYNSEYVAELRGGCKKGY